MTTHLSTGFKVLDSADLNGDGALNVLDIDAIIQSADLFQRADDLRNGV